MISDQEIISELRINALNEGSSLDSVNNVLTELKYTEVEKEQIYKTLRKQGWSLGGQDEDELKKGFSGMPLLSQTSTTPIAKPKIKSHTFRKALVYVYEKIKKIVFVIKNLIYIILGVIIVVVIVMKMAEVINFDLTNEEIMEVIRGNLPRSVIKLIDAIF